MAEAQLECKYGHQHLNSKKSLQNHEKAHEGDRWYRCMGTKTETGKTVPIGRIIRHVLDMMSVRIMFYCIATDIVRRSLWRYSTRVTLSMWHGVK